MSTEKSQRSTEVLTALKEKYPSAKAYDLDGRGEHFLAEVEPVSEHPEYDRAVQVIFSSRPHKHLQMTQKYRVVSGVLVLHVDDQTLTLQTGDTYTIFPGHVHWAESTDGAWVEIYSQPGWTAEDHIVVE